MQPYRRLERQFHEQDQSDDDKPDDHDHEHCRTITTVGEGIVEATGAADLPDTQKTVKELSLTAPGTLSRETCGYRIYRREMSLVFHFIFSGSQIKNARSIQ
jgi:hypothetical protein